MNITSNSTSLICDSARTLLSVNLKRVVIVELIVASLAIWPNLLLLFAVRSVTILPSNLRVLLGHFSCVLIMFSIGDITKGVYLLNTDPCAFAISNPPCRVFELCTSIMPVTIMYYGVFSLCLERFYAMVNYRKYDRNRRPYMAVFFVVFSWLIGSAVNGWSLALLSWNSFSPFCDNTFLASPGAAYLTIIHFTLECVAGVATVCIGVHNRYLARNMAINQARYDLSARFLVAQNVQIDSMVRPSMALHFVCHLPTYALLIPVYTPFWVISPPTKICLNRATMLIRLIYALVDPILAFRFNAHLRQYLGKSVVGKAFKWAGGREWSSVFGASKKPVVGATQAHRAHFDLLNQMWDKNGKK